MSAIELSTLAGLLQRGQTVIGIDLGTKTIGIAVSDLGLTLATPRLVIERRKFSADAAELLAVARRENAGALVIGLPLNMDGSEGPRAQSTRSFQRNLERLTDLPTAFWDERLSTVAAERALIGMDVSRAKRDARIDAAAAAFILQGALDRLQSLPARLT